MDTIFSFPSTLHCQRHWDARLRSQRNLIFYRAEKTCARHQDEDKLRRGHGQAPPVFNQKSKALCSDVTSASQTQLFEDVGIVVNQGEIGSSMS